MITLQQLRYFIAAARSKSFSQAAEALYITQPALSKQISLLEKHLQFPLFERNLQGVTLTDRGKQLFERVQPLIHELDLVLEEITEPTHLRIGVLPSIASYCLPSVISRLESPRLIVTIKNTGNELLEMVNSGELDAAIVQDKDRFGSLKQRLLFEEKYYAAVPINHPISHKDKLKIEDLHEQKIILHNFPCDILDSLETVFQTNGIEPIFSLEATLNESLLSHTVNGMGISFVPAMMAASVTHKQIVYKNIENDPLRRSIHLFARSQSVLTRLSSLFQERIYT